MKPTILLFIGLFLLLLCGSVSSKEFTSKNKALHQGSASIMCTPDLYELASKWASEYSILNPGMKIKVINTKYENIDLGTRENLSFISDKSVAVMNNETNWKMVIGRDVTVPVMNAGNPFLAEILQRGVSPELFAQIFKNPEKQHWGSLLSSGQTAPVHIYIINDESIKARVAEFLQTTQIPVHGITVGNQDEVVSAIQKDPYAIGFCKVVNILGPDNQSLIENVRLLPIDKNGNGKIDYMEEIYNDLNLFLRGVWIGKYPKTLYSNIYVVSKKQPSSETELAFLSWVLTEGQQFMNSKGFCDLITSESQSHLDKISTAIISVPPSKDLYSVTGLVLLIMAVIITSSIIISSVVRRYRNKKTATAGVYTVHAPGFDENSVVVPKGLYFDKTHTWAFMEKDGIVTIGIDDFMQHITGPITRIVMKNPGEKIKKGELLLSIIQSGKQLNMYSPVSGTIKKQNEALITRSSYLNSSPYSEGWVYRIEPINWFKEIQFLDMADKYKRWLDTEFPRVKDFLAATLKPDSLEYAHVVLQDGGVLKDGILSDFGPEIWEDFQTNFLDN